jgi:hypothetical protein
VENIGYRKLNNWSQKYTFKTLLQTGLLIASLHDRLLLTILAQNGKGFFLTAKTFLSSYWFCGALAGIETKLIQKIYASRMDSGWI